MKPSQEIYINFCIEHLNQNKNVNRRDVMPHFVEQFSVTGRTFDKYWALAQKRFIEIQKKITENLEATIIEEADSANRKGILSRLERMEIASKIAKGEAHQVGDKTEIPTQKERLAALEYLSKIDGDFAPDKIAQTNADGSDKDSFIVTTLEDILSKRKK